jgi:predicted RNA-binding protein YlxR (DUF448 family)
MLARVDHDELDAGPRRGPPERLCVATREVKPVSALIRFVVGPDGAVVPDIKRKLPGRGAWVTANRTAVAAAVGRKAFARAFKREVRVASDLAEVTEQRLERAALDALAIAHKAGLVVIGTAKVEAALESGPVLALVHAAEARPDGVRKLDAALRRAVADAADGSVVVNMLESAQLDLALGRSNVIHAALLAGAASAGFLARCRDLERFRQLPPSDAGQEAEGEHRTRRRAAVEK